MIFGASSVCAVVYTSNRTNHIGNNRIERNQVIRNATRISDLWAAKGRKPSNEMWMHTEKVQRTTGMLTVCYMRRIINQKLTERYGKRNIYICILNEIYSVRKRVMIFAISNSSQRLLMLLLQSNQKTKNLIKKSSHSLLLTPPPPRFSSFDFPLCGHFVQQIMIS